MLETISAGLGTVTAGALLCFGAYATVRSRGAGLRNFPAAFRQAFRRDRSGSGFGAFATSLAGTVGVGNLTGVSIAIACGGAGAVFWMWISALLCTTVKQFEITLALKHRLPGKNRSTVPMAYLSEAVGKGFASIFAVAGFFSALLMGNLIQTHAAASAGVLTFGIPFPVWTILFSVGTGAILLGGRKRVVSALEKALPILGVAYLLLGTAGILLRADRILPVLREIFTQAFSFRSAVGGTAGAGAWAAVRYGVANGLFSHEAGLGSAGLAHGLCDTDPQKQGLWGIFEVAADTLIISTVSALFLLTSGVCPTDGNGITQAAEAVFGTWGGPAVGICLIAFAFLSVLSWGTYGEACFCFLCGDRVVPVYRTLFFLAPLCATFVRESSLWAMAEIANGLMLIFHLPGLIGFREELSELIPRRHTGK